MLFAKRTKPSAPPSPPTGDASQTAPSGPDPRDATIERLSRELAAERDNLTTVREALDAARFKVEVLEKSYAKQLADARERLAATEQTLADKTHVLAGLDGGHEDTLRALNDARAELKLVVTERDALRKQIAEGGFRQRSSSQTRAPLATTAEPTDSGGTINQLISSAGWVEKAPRVGSGHASATVSAQDAPHEDMLAPELVFTKGREDDDR
jgi:hypothetical protein